MGYNTCPTDTELNNLSTGFLSDEAADSLLEHLENCPDCELKIEKIERESSSQIANIIPSENNFTSENECLEFVGAVAKRPLNQSSHQSSSSRYANQVGRTIFDYQLLEWLGEGAMGTVYKAKHTLLQKTVAIKLLHDKLGRDPIAVARFQREIKAVGQLNHPNIVAALDAGQEGDSFYLVMEYVDGMDLAALTNDGRSLDIPSACEVIRQAAIGLQQAHSQGLVHRDIKPSNLMLALDGEKKWRVKILDLGLATIHGLEEDSELTDQGQLMGTLKYMAPEQAEDTHNVDHRADIYALGTTFHRLLSGTVPFDDEKTIPPVQRIRRLITQQAPSIRVCLPNIPDGLCELVDEMLARIPQDRPQDMADVAKRLERFSVGHQLGDLLEQHISKERAPDESTFAALRDTTPSISDTVAFRDPQSTNLAEETVISDSGSGFSRRFIAISALAISALAIIILMVVFRLKTDGGYIEIEVADPSIQVAVEILQNGEPEKTIEVERGSTTTWIRSGNYEIRLPSDVDDQFLIENSQLTIKRNDEKVVKIFKRISVPIENDSSKDLEFRTKVVKWIFERNGTLLMLSQKRVSSLSEIEGEPLYFYRAALGEASDDDVRQLVEWLPSIPECHQIHLGGGLENQLTDAAIPFLGQVKNLTWLSLSSSRITDNGLSQFSKMPRVHSLNLDCPQIGKAGLTAIQENFPALEALEFNSLVTSTDILEPITNYPNLYQLGLNLLPETSNALSTVARTNVVELSLRDWGTLTPAAIDLISRMSQLRTLSLTDCRNVEDQQLEVLAKSKTLQEIYLNFDTGITPDGLVHALKVNKNLKVHVGKTMRNAPQLQGHPQIVENIHGETYSLVKVKEKPSERTHPSAVYESGLFNRKKFAHWVIDHSGEITYRDLAVVRNHSDIPKEDLSITSLMLGDIGDKDLELMARWLPFLPDCTSLVLNGGHGQRLTDAAIPVIDKMNQLEYLGISSRMVTDEGLSKLKNLPKLQTLMLDQSHIKQRGYQSLQENFPHVVTLIIYSRVAKGDDLAPLKGMPNLKTLDLNLSVSDQELLRSISRTSVTTLVLRESHTWHSAAASDLSKMRRLEIFRVNNCEQFHDDDLSLIAKSTSLKELHIQHGTSVTEKGILEAINSNSDLKIFIGNPLAESPKLQDENRILLAPSGALTWNINQKK